MFDDFQSHTLQYYLKNKINNSKVYHYKLRQLANCGVVGEVTNGVHVLSNGTDTRILGVKMCGHSWVCPACTAKKMAKYSRRVGAAIDALSEQGYAAFMITFTVFHTKSMTCKQTYELLRKTFHSMTKQANWKRKKKDGSGFYVSSGVWNNFIRDFNIRHTIKTLEVTYGKHGWHPHIHMLFFVEKKRLQEIAKVEESLVEYWEKHCDKIAKEIFTPKQYEIRKFLESKTDREDAEHKSVYISKDDNGNILQVHSGDYICGWGANNELTGGAKELKVARKDNLTPLQMLQQAYDLEYSNPILSRRYLRLYFHLAWFLISHRVHRIDFSRTGLNAITQNWINSEGYKELYKKKCQSLNVAPYHTVCWLTLRTWREVCYINDYLRIPIIPLIVRFATYDNGFELISELFKVNNLPPPLEKHAVYDIAEAFNDRMYGKTAA